MNFNQISQEEQSEVCGSFFGYLQDVEAKANKFAGRITMETVVKAFFNVNPKIKKNQHGFYCLDTDYADDYYKVRTECYESVKPAHMK